MHDETVRLMHYDPRWKQEFEQTRSSILFSCEGWVTGVQHVGSTAISGLIARPTIDVIATVRDRDGLAPARMLIEGLNFRCEDSANWAAEAITLCKPRSPPAGQPDPTHRVMLVQEGSELLRRAIRLRDFFRSHPETAIRWEETKVASWRDCEGDLHRYESDKAIFLAHLSDQLDAAEGGD
ncbi:dephospho-CoA kinase/protein folding accessory domain-containing protein [Rubripirellula lacrimiformis]|uniref:Dephospho-CoA kinase/protein folding accessory domain-containing protein n=1 Tax=Rubripirellula lacrimiformis TaxID=1930273 RepID=A0A517N3T8_9BACT|nr:GrpB family protein [Rubripirellula lacrimiformis]QDT01802.1 dephospho-CoA kinase/protein folding accessory domain-containing protein [Rubripirellula lacrimiformis]